MTHRTASRAGPDGVPSQDDWKNMNAILEKKRAQNRLAQRNYRRNVKRRIEELEQQVATQAKLLALEGEATKHSNQGVSSLAASDVPLSMDRNFGTSTQERQKDASAPLPTPTSQLFVTPEDSSTSDKLLDSLWYCHAQGDTNQHREVFYGNLGAQVADRVPNSTRVERDSQSRGETQRHPPRPESPTQSTDLDIGMLDDVHLRSPIDPFRFSGDHSQSREIEEQWCEFERASNSPDSISDEALLTDGDATFEQTMEGRVEYLIRCARRAGFQDLDSAVSTLYTAKFDEDSECSIAQYLSRKRCLPNLLEELRSKTVSWKTREVQPYQDEVLKSAESLLIGEMRSHRVAGVHKILFGLLSSDGGCRWSAISHQLQDDVSVVSTTNQMIADMGNSCLTFGLF
ncbi:hypothetical protein G6011_02569 [Alternaria panax]|uniref:BZIP domain-containing protein n=1 Tax=Alternaria panax TaxID=48097 RepID=A0AAD4I512_9PLEO|nr:hypothetical protein G6011_02569 [Alternaria panax]